MKVTPHKWLVTKSLDQLFSLLPLKKRTRRKCQLYYVAGCRAVGTLWNFDSVPALIDLAANAIEGVADASHLETAREVVAHQRTRLPPFDSYTPEPGTFLDHYGYAHVSGNLHALRIMLDGNPKLAWEFSQSYAWHSDRFDSTQYHYHSEMVREIFTAAALGIGMAAKCRSEESIALAASMYASQDFTPMPVMADALEDAGCDDEAILSHCRDPHAVHVRGCWVVDLVLGKS